MATRQYTCRGRATKLFKCPCQCPPCHPYCVSGPYLSHHFVLFRPKDLTLHFHPPALLFIDAAVAWVKGRSYWRIVNCGPSCGSCSHRTIQASHGAGCWDVGRSMPLHLLIGHIVDYRKRQTHLPPALHLLIGHTLGMVWITARAGYLSPLWPP